MLITIIGLEEMFCFQKDAAETPHIHSFDKRDAYLGDKYRIVKEKFEHSMESGYSSLMESGYSSHRESKSSSKQLFFKLPCPIPACF